jgi:16S rRNA (uracil1498-N3)-methyltransferase
LPGSNVLILIGPEGDFDSSEIDLAIENGFIPVSLGESRLRTETAGIVACHTAILINQ